MLMFVLVVPCLFMMVKVMLKLGHLRKNVLEAVASAGHRGRNGSLLRHGGLAYLTLEMVFVGSFQCFRLWPSLASLGKFLISHSLVPNAGRATRNLTLARDRSGKRLAIASSSLLR